MHMCCRTSQLCPATRLAYTHASGLFVILATRLFYAQNNHMEIVLIKHCLAHEF